MGTYNDFIGLTTLDAASGLTIKAQMLNADGTPNGALVTGFAEPVAGSYTKQHALPDNADVMFKYTRDNGATWEPDALTLHPCYLAALVALVTPTRAAKLDNLDVAITTRAAAATALSTADWSNARALKLDNLDAAITTRLATAGYTTPDNTSIATILGRVDVAVSTRLAALSYTAPDNTSISTILGRVDVSTSSRLSGAAYTTGQAAIVTAIGNISVLEVSSQLG